MTTEAQKQQILDYLKQGRKLTPLEALQKFGCMRLGARIYDLRKEGHDNIISEMVEVGEEKKRVAQYYFPSKVTQLQLPL